MVDEFTELYMMSLLQQKEVASSVIAVLSTQINRDFKQYLKLSFQRR